MNSLHRARHRLCRLSNQMQTGVATSPPASSLASPASCSGSNSSRSFAVLNASEFSDRVLKCQYAVRGELVIRADQLKVQLSSPAGHSLPFNKIIHCNIGNPQELGQKPLSFNRQVLSLCQYPSLLDDGISFPADVESRASEYLKEVKSMGAYTNSMGITAVRKEVAQFIQKRDGYPADPSHIFLTDGASTAVKTILQLVIRKDKDAVLTPVPQYPLYSATLALLGGDGVDYYLDEEKGWALTEEELEAAIKRGKSEGKNVRALVVINPGNPTGQLLPLSVMEQIVQFCFTHHLLLLADEVYQENVYIERSKFVSFKKVVRDTQTDIELVSFHSTSKGFIGECGQRGGYMELVNIDEKVIAEIYKLASVSLCSNTSGQVMTGLMCHPPGKSDPSYSLYIKERDDILQSLKRRALIVARVLNECTNITCQPVQGAMYAFPRLHLPSRAIAAAKEAKKIPDTFYCLQLLEQTGLVTVPGSGFKQREGQWHLRMTILPREEELNEVLDRFKAFNEQFMSTYRD